MYAVNEGTREILISEQGEEIKKSKGTKKLQVVGRRENDKFYNCKDRSTFNFRLLLW
jgi:hypothetical protein